MNSEKFNIELSANALKMRGELDKANKEIERLTGNFGKADKKQSSFKAGTGKLAGGIALVGSALAAATAAFTAYVTVQGRAQRETLVMANIAGLAVNEFERVSFVFGTAGVTAEKFGDIMKDTQERIGDFLASGGGPFQDFADVMGYTKTEARELAKEFETLSGQDVLQEMVRRMESAGKSSREMSFAFEGIASNSTRLIPLLLDNGKAVKELGEQFDKINIPLTDEERKQFADLATNVDLAQSAFVNFLNNAVSPFLPAINDATLAIADFFAVATGFTELDKLITSNSSFFNVFDKEYIIDVKAINAIQSLKELEAVTKSARQEQSFYLDMLKKGEEQDVEFLSGSDKSKNAALTVAISLLEKQMAKLKERNLLETESNKGNLPTKTGGDKSGAASITDRENLEKELEGLQDAKKTKLQLLNEEKEERLYILEQMYSEDASMKEHYESLKRQVDQDFRLQIMEYSQTDEEAKKESYFNELANQKELFDKKLINEEEYYAKRNEIIGEFAPATLDPELLEEETQGELDALKEKLDKKLVTHREYYEKLAQLQQRDAKIKEGQTKKENWWSESSVKKQMDDGTQLLNYLGNNSKTAHKIKQGLASANAGMNTAEGVTKALAEQNYIGAGITAATGALQIAAILSSTPDGGGANTVQAPSSPAEQPQEEVSVQDTGVFDLSDDGQTSQVLQIQFNDEVIDALAIRVDASKRDGRT